MSGAKEPKELHELFAKYFNEKNLEGMLSLYADDAIMTSPEGEIAPAAYFRAIFGTLLSSGGTMEFTSMATFESGDLALSHGHWKITGGSADNEGTSAELCRRDADGFWRNVIDNPFGGAVLG